MEDAEIVGAALQSGPDMAEFVSDCLALAHAMGVKPDDREIAEMWAERALDPYPEASDSVFEDLVSIVTPQIGYYL